MVRGLAGRRWVAVGCVILAVLAGATAAGCGSAGVDVGDAGAGLEGVGGVPVVLADTTFLADIVQNVAGVRIRVDVIVPRGADPHSFEPTPQNAKAIAESDAVMINVAGLVPRLDDLTSGLGADSPLVVEAASGLVGARQDPHVWLDPTMVVSYVTTIAQALSALDPAGAGIYGENAQAYSQSLLDLDAWIMEQVQTIPPDDRLIVTNHDSLGYFAARYGFRIVGTVFPTVSGQGAPSAQQLGSLVREIEATGAPAIFLETGSNAALALQVGRETGAKVVLELHTASLGENVATYLDMMRWNVTLIVGALR